MPSLAYRAINELHVKVFPSVYSPILSPCPCSCCPSLAPSCLPRFEQANATLTSANEFASKPSSCIIRKASNASSHSSNMHSAAIIEFQDTWSGTGIRSNTLIALPKSPHLAYIETRELGTDAGQDFWPDLTVAAWIWRPMEILDASGRFDDSGKDSVVWGNSGGGHGEIGGYGRVEGVGTGMGTNGLDPCRRRRLRIAGGGGKSLVLAGREEQLGIR
ncbi:hypothetical protein HPP92_000836 [Vanilla planifolia]|uniref:Uncharacterized protein n=1 Tax=Vanilla planifolia TaxID=51239 RepID=A0A835RPM3_VANPL|nr:hypothetical protein HPP92_000836 [Vanilla planifolia]